MSNYRKIWRAVADIPYGRVASYGQIAAHAGLPGCARLVGQALRDSPPELALPWHRVINAQGRISLPKSSPSYQRQIDRLATEGVEIVGGRIDMQRYGWIPDIDELLWKPVDD